MKTSLNIFNELNESFDESFKLNKKVLMEGDGAREDISYRYQLLDRLKSDCEYFLNNRDEKHLWAGSIDAQIAKMKELWSSFGEDEKPEWLTMEDIENYEKEMKGETVEEAEDPLKGKEILNEINAGSNKFYVGDPCYVLSDEVYYDIWDKEYNFEDGVILVDKNNAFQVYGTAYGDGRYLDRDGNEYLVDSGTIALIPVDLIAKTEGIKNGKVFDGSTGNMSVTDGVFTITIDGKLATIIDTKGEDEEEEIEECDKPLKEDEIVRINQVEVEPDYIIKDVTQLEQVADGDVQAPDIKAMISLVDESLKAEYGEDYGNIKILSSKINENGSFALVNISTKEIVKEFEDRGISDIAIGKNLILENAENGLINFKVNSLNGTTKYSKKSADAVQSIREWIETEYLHNSMVAKLEEAEKEKKAEELKAMADEKEVLEFYLASKPELRMELENIKMFIELGKEVKDEEFKAMIQNRMYAFATMVPRTIETPNKEDKYELKFTDNDFIVEELFGKNWVKEVTPDNEVIGLKEENDYVIAEYYPTEQEAKEAATNYKDFNIKYNGGEYELWVPKKEYFKESEKINESYEQFNIGNIEVVFNPETYETLYSIPSADIKDKKINLTKIPTVETPYDTNTIIKDYIETRFGRIPTEGEVKMAKDAEKAIEDNQEDVAPEENTEVDVTPIEVNTTSEEIPEEQVEEAELPEEPTDETTPDGDVNVDVDIDNMDNIEEIPEENQATTGNAVFTKIRPKQSVSLEDIRIKLLDSDTPTSSYIVVDTITLDDEQWNKFTSDLALEEEWLEGLQSIDRKNYSFNVVEVTKPGLNYSILVDPLGYSYPRYVGIQE